MFRDKILYSYPFGLQDAFITFKHLWKPDFYTWLLLLCGFSRPAFVCPCGSAAQGILIVQKEVD